MPPPGECATLPPRVGAHERSENMDVIEAPRIRAMHVEYRSRSHAATSAARDLVRTDPGSRWLWSLLEQAVVYRQVASELDDLLRSLARFEVADDANPFRVPPDGPMR